MIPELHKRYGLRFSNCDFEITSIDDSTVTLQDYYSDKKMGEPYKMSMNFFNENASEPKFK